MHGLCNEMMIFCLNFLGARYSSGILKQKYYYCILKQLSGSFLGKQNFEHIFPNIPIFLHVLPINHKQNGLIVLNLVELHLEIYKLDFHVCQCPISTHL